MWPKEEAPFIRSLLKFSSNVAEANYHDVVSDSELDFISGWENIRPRAIYRSNKCNGRRKLKIASSSPATASRTRLDANNKSPKSTHVMRGTLDDSWNYHYPTGSDSTTTVDARDEKIQEITEDVVKESNTNETWEEVHVQKLREAIAALVTKDHLALAREQLGASTQPGDNTTYHRWGVEKPKMAVKERRVTTIPHQMNQASFNCNSSSQLLNVRKLPVGAWETHQTVNRHKVLDPTVRYELSQLVQSQLYGRLLVEQRSVNDQLLKVSSALILPSSSAARHNGLQGSHSYPNISGRTSTNNTTAALHKYTVPRKF